ncbi:MAG: hypothetical protein IPL46_14110 [Saprospiraceae bacterium]|nr:hypothetical protein [Saprospiraceae bacterium]
MLRLTLIFCVLIIIGGCQKVENDLDNTIAFYSLKEFNTTGQGFAIDESKVKIGNELIIEYEDLISYDVETHTFTISEALAKKMNDTKLDNPYYQKPFALAIGKEIVYTGYFWSLFSSLSCDWTTAYPLGDHLVIRLGYPGQAGLPITDRRNDIRVLNILMRDGKLVE